MGQKTHPISMRVGITKGWQSRWFGPRVAAQYLREDYAIRTFLEEKLKTMGLDSIEIERSGSSLVVIVRSSRPGLIIGRGGTGIEDIKKALLKTLQGVRKGITKTPWLKNLAATRIKPEEKIDLKLQIEEVKQPEASAQIVGNNISEQIEKRIPFRRVLRGMLEKVMAERGVQGAKIKIAGRLDGSEIAREEVMHRGKIPLQTLRADIDYAQSTAYCTYGTVGIQVWIYKGEIFNK